MGISLNVFGKKRLFTSVKVPLHILTATLFIILTIALGIGQIWFSFQKNTELIEESSIVLYEKVMQSAFSDLQQSHQMATSAVEIIAQGNLPETKTLEQRLNFLPAMSKVLEYNGSVSGFEVGFEDGDFFIIRAVYNEYMRNQFKAPAATRYMVDSIDREDTETVAIRLFYDKDLNQISSKLVDNAQYDPRERPWYQLALRSDGYATTDPYLYFFVKKVGITITLESKVKGVVIAADISLDDLSEILAKNVITPSSELVLFDPELSVIAYKEPDRLIVENLHGSDKIATVAELGSPVLAALAGEIMAEPRHLNLLYESEHWGGVIKELSISDSFRLYFAFLAPDKELFAQAFDIRWQSSLIAIALILIAVPVTAYSAYKISEPLRILTVQTRKIRQFDFSTDNIPNSSIKEINTLAKDMDEMKYTISHFMSMIKTLAGEKNLNSLLATITKQTLEISRADAAVLYLLNEAGTCLDPVSIKLATDDNTQLKLSSYETSNSTNMVVKSMQEREARVHYFQRRAEQRSDSFGPVFKHFDTEHIQVLTLPLNNRSGEATGVLCVFNDFDNNSTEDVDNQDKIGFIQSLSGFAAVSMESRHLLKGQKDLLASFIKIIAGAIDAKSHYTAGHCSRVPEITKLLAQAAINKDAGEFEDFSLTEDEWEELDIAAWLHDCGKITTPEYVVDKATKLETIYDRIHEVRMRFEVIKRDAQVEYWQGVASGEDITALTVVLEQKNTQLDADFAFVAQCNLGSEFMSHEHVQKLEQISQQTWQRTLSDRLGISWEEELRKQREPELALPVCEKLLVDKMDQIILRDPKDTLQANNQWGFKMNTPEYQYNRGELYNLSIRRGTLNTEERYKINEHIIQTIIMLKELKFPKNLSRVEEIAGGHHEKMDGTGYPRGLLQDDMSISARMMAIADIFEALTASDRPYKKAKKLSEAIKIMSFMKEDRHIDGSLFDLFLESGIYLQYAKKYLEPEQIDEVDISKYIIANNSEEALIK